MPVDPVSKDILAVCERAGLKVDTVETLAEDTYYVTFYPLALPEPDNVTVQRVKSEQQAYRFKVYPNREREEYPFTEELERLVFVVEDVGMPF